MSCIENHIWCNLTHNHLAYEWKQRCKSFLQEAFRPHFSLATITIGDETKAWAKITRRTHAGHSHRQATETFLFTNAVLRLHRCKDSHKSILMIIYEQSSLAQSMGPALTAFIYDLISIELNKMKVQMTCYNPNFLHFFCWLAYFLCFPWIHSISMQLSWNPPSYSSY